ncbi:MAG: class I SAM-dependent methyltransferase [Bacteroidetes bacterium]|nr:class I SAM-dependent methyltransferase [Bacteroidota bacterium]
MLLLSPEKFPDYELIDCGDFEKLERFGKYITIRPEPQAVWSKKLSSGEWEKTAHVEFIQKGSNSGEWKRLKEMPDKWQIRYVIASGAKQSLQFKLSLTSFKHVGIFPEQSVNWEYIHKSILAMKQFLPLKGEEGGGLRFLNLFAYTGAASLAAKAAGADVTHLDSIKQVVTWARENMELSGLKDIRWIVEDALKFVKREVKRGNKYHGIILDPPAFGNGPEGEKWKLEDNIHEMMQHVFQLLDKENHFMILNAYSLGFSSIIIENLLKDFAKDKLETGELFLQAKSNLKLPLGVFGRFRSF